MSRRLSTIVLLVVLLVSAIASGNIHAENAPVRAHHDHGMGTDRVPTDVQMDRNCADVPKTQMSSPIGSISPDVERIPIVEERLTVPVVASAQPTAIIKQQHVFRI
jgi:hypothetical protein